MTAETRPINFGEAGFFLLETATTPMAGVSTDIYKIPRDYSGDFVADLYKALLKTKVVEPFNQIVHWNSRLPNKSYWETAEQVNLKDHIKRHVLPSPGTDGQLHDLVELLLSTSLDRSAPLWEYHIIEGLKNNCFAVCLKAHHASFDGTGFMARQIASKSTDPKVRKVHGVWSPLPGIHDKPKKERKSKQQSRSVARLLNGPLDFASQARDMWATIGQHGGVVDFVRKNWIPSAPGNTTFNTPGGFGKRVSSIRLSKTKAVRVAKTMGCTVNDVYLATVSAAMNRYLTETGESIDESLKALIPMSLREPGDVEAGNKISNIIVDLGDQNADIVERLESITRDTKAKKAIARSADKHMLLAYTALTGGASAALSLAGGSRQVSNILISNVPGSKQKLYLMGAELQATYAFNVLPPGISLIIVAFSYRSYLDISLVAHRSAVPDIERLPRYMSEGFNELIAAID